MTINFSNSSMEQSLKRIANALEEANEILKKLTVPEDFSEEDATVISSTKNVQDAKGRIPVQK